MLRKPSHSDTPVKEGRRITIGRIGRWTLRAVVLTLALIGFLHITRGTAVRQVRGAAADGAAISVGEPEFPLMATMATGEWLAGGNRVEVMQNGDGTFPRLWEDLRRAQRSITLQVYDEMNRAFIDDLGHSQEIGIEEFRTRTWLQRLAESGANWLTRLLRKATAACSALLARLEAG